MNIIQSMVQSMRGFDLMDITRLFKFSRVLILKICYYCGNCSYDCSVLFIGSCSSYVVSDLNNLLSYTPLVFVTHFKFIYKNNFF